MNNLFDKFQLWIEKKKHIKMEKWAVTRTKGQRRFLWRYRFYFLLMLIALISFGIYFTYGYVSWITLFTSALIFIFSGLLNGRGAWRLNEKEYQAFLKTKADKEMRIKRSEEFMAKH